MKVSLLVCTYNRSKLLEILLRSVASNSCSGNVSVDRVVIDNNSTDTTQDVIRKYADTLRPIVLIEPRQGKTHALNAGLGAARDMDLVVFTDDDVVLNPDWLQAFIDGAGAHPEAAWFGGRVKPDWNGAAPRWMRAETRPAFRGYFIEYDLGEQSRVYREGDPLPLGCAMAVRREVIDRVGNFRTDLGPRGRARGMGDDTDYIQRAIEAGFAGWYVAEAVCHHHVHPSRYRLIEYYRYGHAKGLNQARWGMTNGLNAAAPGKVKYFGTLTTDEVAEQIYRQADVLLLTSLWETGPIVIWEAMSHGLAVVSSKYVGSGAEQALWHEENCMLFAIGDSKAAASHIMTLLSDDTRRKIAAAGRAMVSERYSRWASVVSWSDVLTRIVQNEPRSESRISFPIERRGRLDRVFGVGAAETMRRALKKGFSHAETGAEWPHTHSHSGKVDSFIQKAAALDVRS